MPEETPDLEAPLAPRPKGRKKRTNEEIFEQYRSAVEPMLKRKSAWEDLMANDHQFVFSKWMYRYLRRKHDMEKMIDILAHDALLARYSTEDEVVRGRSRLGPMDWPVSPGLFCLNSESAWAGSVPPAVAGGSMTLCNIAMDLNAEV